MKSRVKATLIAVALAIALPVLVWVGAFLYWHIRIKGEIRSLESAPKYHYVDAPYFIVFPGGCRCLPYMIDALETSGHPMMVYSATEMIAQEVGEDGPQVLELLKAHPIGVDDPPEVRRANFRKVREWWEANGAKYHQWWRVWSPKCSS